MSKLQFFYFDCKGRAEGLRYMLYDSGVEFEDKRQDITPENTQRWQNELKNHVLTAGHFNALPIINVTTEDENIFTLSQTLAIGNFLSEKLGYFEQLTPLQRHSSIMIATAAYEDILVPSNMLIWAKTRNPNIDLESEFLKTKSLLLTRLANIEKLLAASPSPTFFNNVSYADFFVFYAFQKVATIFYSPLNINVNNEGEDEDTLLKRFPLLWKHAMMMSERPNLKNYLCSKLCPSRQTGCPNEDSAFHDFTSFKRK